jgi:class 3 adenylate cyclase
MFEESLRGSGCQPLVPLTYFSACLMMRFVNSAGNSVLAEFASVVNAVQCGVDIQSALKAENLNLPAERRMEFRIGINLGDVRSALPRKNPDRDGTQALATSSGTRWG